VEVETGAVNRAGAFGDQHLELAVGPDDVEGLEQGGYEGRVEAIALVGPIQDDTGDARVLDSLEHKFRPLFQPAPRFGHWAHLIR
jgi:hypothetical protein